MEYKNPNKVVSDIEIIKAILSEKAIVTPLEFETKKLEHIRKLKPTIKK